MEEDVANDHGAEESTIEYPLSPELNTARIKKKGKRSRKRLNLSVLGLNTDYVSKGCFKVSQESSSNEGSSVFSNNHETHGETSYTTLQKDYEALSEASLNEISRTTNNDVLRMLIRDQDKNVIGDQDNKLTSELNCSNTDNTLKKDGGLLDLEKSPILSTNTSKKDGRLLDLEKSPILSTNTSKKDGRLLDLEKSPILSTNTSKKDGRLLDLEKSPILSTNTSKKDGRLLDLEKSPILSTNTSKKDGRLLDLEKSPILSTNTSKKDGRLLDLEKSPILSTNTSKKDGRLLDLEKSPILSTNTSKKDGRLLDLEKSPILSTNTSKKDGRLLDLEKSPILSTKTLKKDGRLLDLEKSPSLSTNTLKKDGGLLDLKKSPILSNNTLKKDGGLLDLEKSPILNSNCHKKKYRRLKKRKILNDTDVNDEYANVSESNQLQKNESQCRDSNMLPNEFSDLSFSILEEICQTTELSFNRDKDDLKSSNDDDLSKIKSASVLCGKLSSNLGKKEKKPVCDKLVTTNFKVIERDNNSDVTSRIVIDRKDSDRRCGSIYISNSIRERKPIANSGSINTLLQSAKLLDDSESVSYLEETKKQKDFKLMCRKKLNDGSYICFESISKGNNKNDNHDRGASKIRGRNDNKVLFDKSSLMDKYNIDMNNTLNISSQQFDDLISCAEKMNSSEKTKVGINSRLEINSKSSNEFHEQQKTLNEIKTGLLRYCPSNGVSEEESCKPTIHANSSKKISHFQKLETNKSMLSEKGNRNATISSKSSKKIRNEAHTRNDPIESETLAKSVETDNVDKLLQEWDFKKDREALNCEKDNTTSAECFEQRTTSEKSKLELGLVGSASRRFSTVSEDPTSEESLINDEILFSKNNCTAYRTFSTANGKSISVSKVALSKTNALLTENECNHTASSTGDEELNALFDDFKGETIGMSKNVLIKTSTLSYNNCNSKYANEVSISTENPIKVSEKLLVRERTHSARKESCYPDIPELSTTELKSLSNLEGLPRNGSTLFEKKDSNEHRFSGFSTARGKSIRVSEEALIKARTLLSEKENFDTNLTELPTDERKSILLSEETHSKTNTLLHEKESDESAYCGFSTAKGKSISVSDEAIAKAKQLLHEETSDGNVFCGFSTAKGNSIPVSDEALSKAKQLLHEETSDGNVYCGFSTAKGKSIHVPDEALAKARTLLHEKESDESAYCGFPNAKGKSIPVLDEALYKAKQLLYEETSDGKVFCGFSTAKGKSIHVPDEALAKARTLLHQKESDESAYCGFTNAKGKSIPVSDEALSKAKQLLYEETEDGNVFCGFSTAKGKSIPVSDEALSKAKHLLHEETSDGNVFCGFSTAKGKLIPVSDEAIAKAKQLLHEETSDENEFCGFSTAKGKSTNVSDEAIVKAKQLLHEETSEGNAFCRFSTAKGKSIPVSDEALSKAKQLLHEETSDGNVFCGFSTAKGKSIPVSDEALSKAKQLLHEETSDGNVFCGFSTAKGKSIPVSDEAIAKAKQLLHEETCDGNVFCGFSTAKGKSIPVSDEAIAKAKQLLHEETSDGNVFCGFSTAKGKSIPVSDEALSKAKQLLHEETCDGNVFCGFSTAKGKSIPVSDEAIAKAKQLLHEETSDGNVSCGFSTAKGKSIPVSDEALSKAKQLLHEETCDGNVFCGFSTAKGKSIPVSDEAIAKAKQLLHEETSDGNVFCGFSSAKGKSIPVSDEAIAKAKQLLHEETSDGNVFCGFSTAKGKSIPVSDEAIAKAKQLLHEETSDGNVFCGFSTAKGKSIPVSDEAIAKAKQLLHEETSDGNVFCGFSTAKGKSIPVSDEAIAKAKQLLHEETSDGNVFCGFSTAKGKSSNVSDEALAKARTLLHEETSDENEFFGFSTAKGKSINVSEEALAKAKTLFYENEYDEDALLKFSTAKDKSVLVSNKPSVKAKTCFQDNKSFGDEICVFSTVEGQSIATSVEPLAKARILLSDEDEELNTRHESRLDNENHKLDTISEQLSLEDSCINKHFLSLSPDKYKTSPNRHSQFYEDMPCLSLSFVDEVSESTAAFLADEDVPEFKDPPVWLRTFVTSPSFIQDRSDALSPILCTDSEIKMRKKRACSPVLGLGDRFKKRKKRLKFSKSKLDEDQVAGCSTPIMNSKLKKNQEDPYNNFIGNLKTSTPISINRTKIKRTIQIDEPNCACEKKLKMMDSWDDDSQVDQTIFYQLDVIEGRRKAAENQELLLKNGKDKSLTKMQKGALFVKRQVGQRIPLRSLVKFPRTMLSTAQLIGKGIKQSVIGINYENAAEFRFSSSNSLSKYICESNCDGIPVGDNALVILSDDGSAGLKEISRAFLASPGIDPTLISHEWIANHFRSIVWKLASTERSFPHLLAGSYLTLDNLLLQLRYRYDREIDDCQRSCLRKILETDESAARRMVLCVSEILVNKSSATKEVKLTDGWYRINASVDEEMMCLIDRGKVAVGTKLVVQGCELLNCEQGHDPLHVPNTVQLKLHTNCARRARWDCRLGFCQTQGPILVGKLKDILPKGGNIGRIDVLVVRVYPLVYMLKTKDGKSVVYSKKREEQECLLNERKMTELIEKLQSQVQREMDEISNRKSNYNQDDESLPSQDLVESGQIPTRDQMRIMTNLREQEQRKYQETLRQKLDEKMSENCPEKRKSIPMLKVRVIDARASNEDKNSTLQTAMLTVWKPTEDVENVLVEGNIISLYSVTAHGKRSGELQLSTGRQTKYSVGAKSEAFSRECHLLCDISRSLSPLFSEINTVGLVVHVESSSTSVETAYLTDDQNNYLGVRFWGGIKKYGWQSCVCVGSEISCSNLEWRSTVSRSNVPYVFVTELSVFSSNPRSKYLQNALDQFKNSIKRIDMKELLSKSKEHLLDMLNGGGTGNYSYDSFSKMSSVSVSGETSAITPSNKNLLTESPLSSVKSKVLMEKMQKLLGYGNAPAITAMPSLQVSPALKKDFKTPNRKSL